MSATIADTDSLGRRLYPASSRLALERDRPMIADTASRGRQLYICSQAGACSRRRRRHIPFWFTCKTMGGGSLRFCSMGVGSLLLSSVFSQFDDCSPTVLQIKSLSSPGDWHLPPPRKDSGSTGICSVDSEIRVLEKSSDVSKNVVCRNAGSSSNSRYLRLRLRRYHSWLKKSKKIVVLNCWIPCWAGPFFDPRATARARWTPPKARSSRFTRPVSRSRPHRAVPTSQRHGYQAEDVRLHSLDSNRVSGFNSWPLGLTLPGFNYPPRSSAGSSGPRPGLSDSLESASSSRCHVSPPSVPRSRLPRSTRSVRSRAVRPER